MPPNCDHIVGLEQACVACMSVAMRFLGDWDRALAIACEVLDDEQAPEVFRMVAQEETGLIAALRGSRRRARTPLRRAAAFGRTIEFFGLEVCATWGTHGGQRLPHGPAARRQTTARDCASELAAMGEQVDRRLGRLAARALEPAGLTPPGKGSPAACSPKAGPTGRSASSCSSAPAPSTCTCATCSPSSTAPPGLPPRSAACSNRWRREPERRRDRDRGLSRARKSARPRRSSDSASGRR